MEQEQKDYIGGIMMNKGTVNLEALRYISRISSGGMRDAITLLDKCLSLSHHLTLENVLKTIGSESYETFFEFLGMLINKDERSISIIENVFNAGKDVKQFMKEYAKFILDVEKYIIYNSFDYISIPRTMDNECNLKGLCLEAESKEVFNVMDFVVSLNSQIKWENDARTLIELSILIYCGKE